MTGDELRHHIGYNLWATRRTLDAVRKVPPAEVDRIRLTLGHIYDADRIWFARLSGAAPVRFSDPPPSMEDIERDWPALMERWEGWGRSLTDADGDRAVAYANTKGEPFKDRLADIVLHVVNHGSYHRGQVAAMLRHLGFKPSGTDITLFLRSRAGGHHVG
jgi:uncharacterized damage-inducible protein DinB